MESLKFPDQCLSASGVEIDTWTHTDPSQILSISGWWFNTLSSPFVFPHPELPNINILYGCCGTYDQCELYLGLFSPITSSKLIIFYLVLLNSIKIINI